MTALADVLRWFRTRNDPPAMLPDWVRWTTLTVREPEEFVARLNETETHDGHGWVLAAVTPLNAGDYRVRLIRDDGRYRSRDDGMRGL